MSVKFKIQRGGTARGDENLCATCSFALRRRMAGSNDETTRCGITEHIVPGAVAECSGYKNANTPSLGAMKEIAWVINADKKTGAAGFLNPSQFKKAVKEGKVEEEETFVLPDGEVAW